MDPIQAETEDVYCPQIDQNSRGFQPGQLKTHPCKDESLDHGTQGLNPSDMPKLWLQPPDFLSTPQDSWIFAEDSDPQICAAQATQLQTLRLKNFQHGVDYSTLLEWC